MRNKNVANIKINTIDETLAYQQSSNLYILKCEVMELDKARDFQY
jgi:hypothetical protein